jgi:hypothetical protein
MADTLRVLTVRQPWAWAIIHGGKDVENRSRNIAGDYRGPVAIHAGLHPFEQDNDASRAHAAAHGGEVPTTLHYGAVIGVVDLIDVHEWSDDSVCYGREGADGEATCSPWGMTDQHHLVLANPRPLARPIPAKGALGLWRPDTTLEAAIWQQVAA